MRGMKLRCFRVALLASSALYSILSCVSGVVTPVQAADRIVSAAGGSSLTPSSNETVDLLTVGNANGESGTLNVGSGVTYLTNGKNVTFDPGGKSRPLTYSTGGIVGNQSGSTGTVTVSGTGTWTNSAYTVIGNQTGATGTVNVTGNGGWTNGGELIVGWRGKGDLNVTGGGTVSNVREGAVGRWTGSEGRVTVSGPGSSWTTRDQLLVGWYGTGTMTIADGGTVSNTYGFIGQSTGGNGTVVVTGRNSAWRNSDEFLIGYGGNGTLTIQNGGTVSNTDGTIAYSSGTTGVATVTGADSTWTNSGDNLHVGWGGAGKLTIADGGLVTVGTQSGGAYNGTLTIARDSRSSGTVNIGAASGSAAAAAGTVKARSLVFGNGTGRLVLNHTGSNVTLSSSITTKSAASTGTIEVLSGGTTLGGTVSGPGNIDLAISGGSLTIAGPSYSGRAITVASGGSLTLARSAATTLSGAYRQTGGSLILNPGNQLVLRGSNAATVTNTAITLSGSSLTAGSYTLVDTNVAGTYGNNNLNLRGASGLRGVLSTADNGHDLIATLTSCTSCAYEASGTTVGAGGVGGALDRLAASSTLSSDMSAVLDRIDALGSDSAKAEVIKQLAPSQTTASAQMSQAAAAVVTGAVEHHQQTAMGYDPVNGVAAGSEAFNSSLWGQVLGGGAIRGKTAANDGYRLHEFGLAAGVDHMISDSVMGGVALSWLRALSTASSGNGTDSTLDSYQATFYGTYRLDRFFVDGQVGFGYNRFHQNREIAFLGRTATADYDGQQYLASAQSGYDLSLGEGIMLTPLAGVSWLRAVSGGYTESGADSANLTVTERGVNSLSHDLGARLSWAVGTDVGLLRPEVRAEWIHDYLQGSILTAGTIDGAGFSSSTARLSPDGARIGLAVALNGPDDLSLRIDYTGEMRPQYQSHIGMVKTIWGF